MEQACLLGHTPDFFVTHATYYVPDLLGYRYEVAVDGQRFPIILNEQQHRPHLLGRVKRVLRSANWSEAALTIWTEDYLRNCAIEAQKRVAEKGV